MFDITDDERSREGTSAFLSTEKAIMIIGGATLATGHLNKATNLAVSSECRDALHWPIVAESGRCGSSRTPAVTEIDATLGQPGSLAVSPGQCNAGNSAE